MMREIPIEKNDDIEFTIDALGSEGQGIGRVDGYTVFVPLALPGEKIRAHVIKTTSGYGVAKLTEVMDRRRIGLSRIARHIPAAAAAPCGT